MALSTQRADTDSSIQVHRWDARHNVLADGPDRVLEFLRTLSGYTKPPTQTHRPCQLNIVATRSA